jgi:hypothetical protein
MRKSQALLVLLLAVCISSLISAQEPADDAAKEKQKRKDLLVEQILAEIPNLKLAENRALVYARVGGLEWNSDQARARSLFQAAIAELINAQTLAEANQARVSYQNELLTSGSTRPAILQAIAANDAELALSALVRTRPAAVAKAMMAPAAKTDKISNYAQNNNYVAQNELNMEQTFVRLAADQNPERAIKLLKDSLAKGPSNESLNLLKKLAEKDRSAAKEIGAQLVDKLIQANITVNNLPNYPNIQISIAYLNDFIAVQKQSEGIFADSQMQKLADKLVSYFRTNHGGYMDYSIVTIAEKLSPAAAPQLKQHVNNGWNEGGLRPAYDPELSNLMNSSETPPDQLLSLVGKYPHSRQMIVQNVANRFAQQGDVNRAAELIKDNFADDTLDEAMRNLNQQYANFLINQGRFIEAERVIDQFPENSRFSALISLATNIFQKDNAENKTYALAVVSKAIGLLPEKPVTSTDMSNFMQVIRAYSDIEPAEASRMYEGLVPQLNELIDGAAVINEFQGGGNVREGEFLLSQGYWINSYGVDVSAFRNLANKDFNGSIGLIDGFSRREIRISMKLDLASSL